MRFLVVLMTAMVAVGSGCSVFESSHCKKCGLHQQNTRWNAGVSVYAGQTEEWDGDRLDNYGIVFGFSFGSGSNPPLATPPNMTSINVRNNLSQSQSQTQNQNQEQSQSQNNSGSGNSGGGHGHGHGNGHDNGHQNGHSHSHD